MLCLSVMAKERPGSARRTNPVRRRPREDVAEDNHESEVTAATTAEQEQAPSGSSSNTSSDGNTSSGGSSDDDHEGSSGTSMEDEVEVDIEFFDPKPEDFHGVKALLEGLLGGTTYNVSSLADAIIEQSIVGTVVKSGEDEQPIGVASLLNVKRYGDLEAMQQIKAHLIRSCADAATREKLLPALEDARTGLLVNERVINCPPQIGPPVMKALFDEIEWAVQDGSTSEIQDSFRIRQFLIIAPAFIDPTSVVSAPEAIKGDPTRPAKKKAKVSSEQQIVYVKPDDEYFHRNAKWSFTFASGKPSGVEIDSSELQPLRLVMLVTAEDSINARKELDDAIERVGGETGTLQPLPDTRA